MSKSKEEAAPAPAPDPPLPTAAEVNAAGDKAIAKHKGTQNEEAAVIFKARRLTGEEFEAKQQEAYEYMRKKKGDEYDGVEGLISEQVVDPAELRKIFLEDLGDEVNSKDLFALVQAADPDGDGWVQLDAFLEVVAMRRTQLERIAAEAMVAEAYVALGGDADKSRSIKSDLLRAVVADFVGPSAAEGAMKAVVDFKMKALEEVLGAGGQLDEEDMEELKDVSKLSFEELQAFGKGLAALGPDPVGGLDADGGPDGDPADPE